MTKLIFTVMLTLLSVFTGAAENGQKDGWKIVADTYDDNYTGIPVANGMLGILPWKEPFSVRHIMLNHVFERVNDVNCAVRGINPFCLSMSVDGARVSETEVSSWRQTIDMRNAEHITEFIACGKVSVRYGVTALRNLPYAMMMEVEIKALEDVNVDFCNSFSLPEEYKTARIQRRNFLADGHHRNRKG